MPAATSTARPAAARAARPPRALPARELYGLRWITDQYAARLDVLAHVLGGPAPLSVTRTRAVVARWRAAGLVDARRFLADGPAFVWPTPAGQRVTGTGYRAKRPSVGLLTHLHLVGLVRLAVERCGGREWTSERALYRERPVPGAHVADGRFRTPGGVATAVEVELTAKSGARLRRIVDDLAVDHDAVLYVVRGPGVRAAVARALEFVAWDRVELMDADAFMMPGADRRR